MNRRTFLTTAIVAVSGLLGGCSGTGNGNSGTNGTAATATETPTGAGEPTTGTPRPTTTHEPTDESARITEVRTETTPASETTAATAPTTAANATRRTSVPDVPSTGEGADVTRVAFEKGGSRVVVSGTILAENGCRKATLASVEAKGSDLVVTVGTERSAGTNAMCTQALTPVEYRFSLTPDIAPESVTVVHATMGERRTVTTVKRGG